MELIVRNRRDAVTLIEHGTDLLIETVENYRRGLPRTDSTALVFGIGDSVANMAKTMFAGNADFRQMVGGIHDRGVAWVIRVAANTLSNLLQTASTEQLRALASYLREGATILEGVVSNETANQTE